MGSTQAAPTVLLGISAAPSATLLCQQLAAAGCETDCAHTISEAIALLESRRFELVVLDRSLNGSEELDSYSVCQLRNRLSAQTPLVFTSTEGQLTVPEVTAAMRAGADDVIEMPPSEIAVARLVRWAREQRFVAIGDAAQNGNPPGGPQASANGRVKGEQVTELGDLLVGESAAIASIRRMILEVAPTLACMIIVGEKGTGKELVARVIHRFSKRAGGPFVSANLSAVPPDAVEGLLFGREQLPDQIDSLVPECWCDAADGGTLFLDEVANLEIPLQPKLVRFLQDETFQPLGSLTARHKSVRMIAATNQEPALLVGDGRLREDLYFRLHVVPIYLPPLRERPEDIPALARLFLRRAAQRHELCVESFSNDALSVLQQHDWPGNVRQLENTVERLVIFSHGTVIEADQIPADDQLASAYVVHRQMHSKGKRAAGNLVDSIVSLTPIERHERAAIVDALRRVDGHVIHAARLLGLGQATVYRKVKQYGIPHATKRRMKKPN